MNHLTNMEKSIFGATGSTTDANRLYSVLLDTRASSVSENMYDIAEKLLNNEKDNSKVALEQLWALKKNLDNENENGTVDLLINFYQDKLNVLRDKEEHIKKVSRDSRELLEEKRKRDSEIATVKQELVDCNEEIERLNSKSAELNVKEQELTLIEKQLQKELQLNANEVVNGLYEIILSFKENAGTDFSLDKELQNDTVESDTVETETEQQEIESGIIPEVSDTTKLSIYDVSATITNEPKPSDENKKIFANYVAELEADKTEIVAPYPKSVVKTTRGIVIGEYYYDPKVPKNNRNYIYNSNFFRKHLFKAVNTLITKFDQILHAEAIQLIQDSFKRISESNSLHFEISTNEILNKKTLKELWHKMMQKEYNDVLIICNRLKAKIEALGSNYMMMLSEQMTRYNEN